MKILKIYGNIEPVDSVSFYQTYANLLSKESSILYWFLMTQNVINNQISIPSYELNRFMRFYSLTEESFKTQLEELERLNLIKVSTKENSDSNTEITVKFGKIKSVREALLDKDLGTKLKQSLFKDKYSELAKATGLTLSELGYEEDSEDILDAETYRKFYGGVFKLVGGRFNFCDGVLELVREHYLNRKSLPLERLHLLAFQSIIDKNGQKIIDLSKFLFLIKNAINEQLEILSVNKYDDFWRNLVNAKKDKVFSDFQELFGNHEFVNFYKQLNEKSEVPFALQKWAKNCVQNNHLEFPVINATISFVKTLLNKTPPINYLIKFTDTLVLNGCKSTEDFLNHVKSVIIYDMEHKNRLKLKLEVINEKDDFGIKDSKVIDEDGYEFTFPFENR